MLFDFAYLPYGFCIAIKILIFVSQTKAAKSESALWAMSCDSLPRKIFSNESTQGFLTSPGYPRSYPPNQRCTVELSTPKTSGLVIHVFFMDLDLEQRFSKSKQCLRDYVIFTIYDREGRQHIGERICGSATGGELPEPIKAMQTRIRVTFVSSSGQSTSRRGFKVRYEFVAEAIISAPPSLYFDSNTRFRRECGGQNDVYGLSGTITSPGYPFTFPGNVSCIWLVRVHPGKRIYIRLLHLELSPTVAECERASLHIVDGYQHEENFHYEITTRKLNDKGDMKFCGSVNYYTEEGMKSYLSTSNRVLVKFKTKDHPSADQMTAYQQDGTPIGFQLLWTEVDSLVSQDGQRLNGDSSGFCPGGFLCQGGEFCVDDSHSICADRTRLCINSTLKCDGISNCAENDDSDEQYCYSRGSLTLIGLAAVFSLVLLFLVSSLFVCKLYCRRKRVEKHKRIEGSRKDFSEKITTITKASPSEIPKEDHAKLLSKQTRKQNAQTTATCARPNFHKTSPRPRAVTVQDRNRRPSQAQENIVNGLSNKHTIDPPANQNCQNSMNDRKDLSEEPPVWEMAPQGPGQLTSFKVGVDTTAANENLDDFAQSIQIIRRALV